MAKPKYGQIIAEVADGVTVANGSGSSGSIAGFTSTPGEITSIDPATGRSYLGLGTMATQNANAVAITGGSITGVTTLTITSHLLWSAGNTYDIGATGTRPRVIYGAQLDILNPASDTIVNIGPSIAGTDTQVSIRAAAGRSSILSFVNGGAENFRLHGSTELKLATLSGSLADRWKWTLAGDFLAATDNATDIGAVGANRPRNIYLAANIYTNEAAQIIRGKTTLTSHAGVGLGTLANAPTAGDPTKWIGIDDNGTLRKVPSWT